MSRCNTLHRAATDYLAAGLCVLSARRAEKRPAMGRWKQYRNRLPTEAELSAWFANRPDAVCILCGAASNNLEIIDFDLPGRQAGGVGECRPEIARRGWQFLLR